MCSLCTAQVRLQVTSGRTRERMERKSADGLKGWRSDRQPLLPSLMSKWPVLSLPSDSAPWGQPDMTCAFQSQLSYPAGPLRAEPDSEGRWCAYNLDTVRSVSRTSLKSLEDASFGFCFCFAPTPPPNKTVFAAVAWLGYSSVSPGFPSMPRRRTSFSAPPTVPKLSLQRWALRFPWSR